MFKDACICHFAFILIFIEEASISFHCTDSVWMSVYLRNSKCGVKVVIYLESIGLTHEGAEDM